MSNNYGKAFEKKFKEDWLKVPNSDITRLYDITNGFKSISNVSDFIGYIFPFIYYLECKSTQGNTFPLGRLTQNFELSKKMGKLGENPGVIIWFIDHQKVCYVPIEEIKRLESLDYKSVNVKMIGDSNFNVYEIPGKPKRTFIDSDYSIMKDIAMEKFKKMVSELYQKSPDNFWETLAMLINKL